MTARKAALICAPLLLSPLLNGCYRRTPLGTITPAPASRIVAALTDSGTVAMGNALGPGALEVEGVVSSANESEWTLELVRVDHRDNRSIAWNRERVKFARGSLTDPFVVVLDKPRSWLAAAGITIGALVVARAFGVLGTADDTERPPPPPATIVPIPDGGDQ